MAGSPPSMSWRRGRRGIREPSRVINDPPMKRVTELTIPGPGGALAMRLYEPEKAGEKAIVYLHGGMWMPGDLETHDRTCRRLAAATRVRVLLATRFLASSLRCA
ncbi:MAG: alpha/beta hydrolase fold domain-containing protein [Solirubrobacterales bacterium]|nr:alpha/beta hydrolase fold domain-containing protein [Solirubrobacterales bacterium]